MNRNSIITSVLYLKTNEIISLFKSNNKIKKIFLIYLIEKYHNIKKKNIMD